MCMSSPPVGLQKCFFAWSFLQVSTKCLQTATALARLRLCAGSPEPLLVACVISTLFSCAGSILQNSTMIISCNKFQGRFAPRYISEPPLFINRQTFIIQSSTEKKIPRYMLALVMLNKLRCHTHFWFTTNQITWSGFLIEIHILYDKQCRSRSVSFFRSQLIWIYTVC